jgi:hypothetical protein
MRLGQLEDHRAVRDRTRCVIAGDCPAEPAGRRRAGQK